MNYTDESRGKIQNKEYARRIIDFSGMRYGNITPTDIDGVIEYHNTHVVFFEFKYDNVPIPDGQRIALERLVNNCTTAGKLAILCICRHRTPEGQHIDAAQSLVTEIYVGGGGYGGGQWVRNCTGATSNRFATLFSIGGFK